MSFEVKILGSNSATPVYNRNQSSQLVSIENRFFLVDCGEATQHQLLRYGVKSQKIDYIFISHLHGDHYLGLQGLISTMHLNGRTRPLQIFGPPGLDEIITVQLKYSETVLQYPIEFHLNDTTANKVILELDNLTVETIPLNHRIACCGFLFREKPKKRRILKYAIPEDLALLEIVALKNGEDIYRNGELYLKNEEVTSHPKKNRSFAYCSDTRYTESIIPIIKDVDLLFHESTFLDDFKLRAIDTFHTTALEAATIAQKANVGKLILGHYSSRYKDITPIVEEARTVFENSYLAIEGEIFKISDEVRGV